MLDIARILSTELSLTPVQVTNALELEDLYLPFQPKRRTRATIARERGLESLARFIEGLNAPDAAPASIEAEAAKYVSAEHEIATAADALAGASDILAEDVSERADLRAHVRATTS